MEDLSASFEFGSQTGERADLEVHKRVRQMREERGWSRSELARQFGTTPSHIQKLEDGNLKISLELMRKFARVFGVKMAALLPPEENDFSSSPDIQELLEAFYEVPIADRATLLNAAKAIAGTARTIAAQMSGNVLPGDPQLSTQMYEKWGNWTDQQRREALNLLSTIDRFSAG